MRIFQNSGIYPTYLKRLNALPNSRDSFRARTEAFLADRFGAAHFLKPVLDGDVDAFFTNGDDKFGQRLWAQENGLSGRCSAEDILVAQIEDHKAEVFYNLDPMRYGSDFVRKLPGCVRRSFAWRAAPSPGADFGGYHGVLCNFPDILESYRRLGWRASYFYPAHDPMMGRYATREDRPVDVIFVGGYTRHHRRRADLLEAVASMSDEFEIHFHLDNSRMTRLSEWPLGQLLPIRKYRRPEKIRTIAHEAIFGLALYEALSNAKIVLNGAIDMAGSDRGNMRCFEAMGCGALLISDAGNYPEGMIDGRSMITYSRPEEAVQSIRVMLSDQATCQHIARRGHELMISSYSKDQQWQAFLDIVETS